MSNMTIIHSFCMDITKSALEVLDIVTDDPLTPSVALKRYSHMLRLASIYADNKNYQDAEVIIDLKLHLYTFL